MSELVKRLATGEHPVSIGGPNRSLQAFKKRLEVMGSIFIRSTDTQGDTDLGLQVDKVATNAQKANFDQGTGVVHVEGNLTLNYLVVRGVADNDLATREGTGHQVVVSDLTHRGLKKLRC